VEKQEEAKEKGNASGDRTGTFYGKWRLFDGRLPNWKACFPLCDRNRDKGENRKAHFPARREMPAGFPRSMRGTRGVRFFRDGWCPCWMSKPWEAFPFCSGEGVKGGKQGQPWRKGRVVPLRMWN